MDIKCIAIGNRIMKDDSIGIKLVESIESKLVNEGITVIIGETDIDYSMNQIKPDDVIFIIDSSYFNLSPGTITVTSISENQLNKGYRISQHHFNLIDLIKSNMNPIRGYVIGIEIEEIAFGLELSDCLNRMFNSLCEEVYQIILNKIKEFQNA